MKRFWMVGLVAALSTGACASSSAEWDGEGVYPRPRQTTVRIFVQNRNFADARLYTYRRGARAMLGTITGKTERNFVIDWDQPDPMYMEIDMVAGPKCFTPELQVDPGDILELQIAVNFNDTPGCTRR